MSAARGPHALTLRANAREIDSASMNEQQKAYWNEVAGPRWVAADDVVAGIEARFLDRLLAAAAPVPGESALDIGCGSGRSTALLAHAVGSRGRVVGVDLSRPLLELARERLAHEVLDGVVELLEDDAQTHRFAAGAFDLVLSIFGVMFFEDPRAAFANLRGALRAGGRVVFLCWRSPRENPWVVVPFEAAAQHLELPRPEPGAPGPFAFADPQRVRGILEAAGFTAIELSPCDEEVDMAPNVGQALEFLQRVGPLASPLAQADPADRRRALQAVGQALGERAGDGPVRFQGATWLVRATR